MAQTPATDVLKGINRLQQQFLAFLYGAAVSVLLARVFILQAVPPPSVTSSTPIQIIPANVNWTAIKKFLEEISFLSFALIFVSVEWLSRRTSNNRLLGENGFAPGPVKITVFSLSAIWALEIMTLAIIILAIGNFLTLIYGSQPTGYLPHILFAVFALLTFIWEVSYIAADPITGSELVYASFWGDVSSLHRIKDVWQPWFQKRLRTCIATAARPAFRSRFKERVARTLLTFSSQYLCQHLVVLNLWFFFVILITATACNGQSIIGYSFGVQDLSEFIRISMLLIVLSFIFFLLGSDTQPGTRPVQAKRLGSVFLVVGITLLHLSLVPNILVLVIALQQLLATIALLPPSDMQPVVTFQRSS